jgi:hypothetical protein
MGRESRICPTPNQLHLPFSSTADSEERRRGGEMLPSKKESKKSQATEPENKNVIGKSN